MRPVPEQVDISFCFPHEPNRTTQNSFPVSAPRSFKPLSCPSQYAALLKLTLKDRIAVFPSLKLLWLHILPGLLFAGPHPLTALLLVLWVLGDISLLLTWLLPQTPPSYGGQHLLKEGLGFNVPWGTQGSLLILNFSNVLEEPNEV